MPADVADDRVQRAVAALDDVVEVAAQQRLLGAGLVAGEDPHLRVLDQRGGEQTALQAGVLVGAQPGVAQRPAHPVGAAALDGVAHGPGQRGAVDEVLDQVVLRTDPHRVGAELLVAQAREHEHGRAVGVEQPAQALEAVGVGQRQVEQHAVDGLRVVQRGLGVGERLGALEVDGEVGVGEVLGDQDGVGVVVLDEQHPQRGGRVRLHRLHEPLLPGHGSAER